MKADVFPVDYMYSNDLIVLFLLTYFSIGGRCGLISDNVFFYNVISSGIDLNILQTVPVSKEYFLYKMRTLDKKTDAMSQKIKITSPCFTNIF